MKRLPIFALLLSTSLLSFHADAQQANATEDPTTWTYEVKPKGNGNYDLVFHLTLKKDWHVWSMQPGGDGFLIPTSFAFDKKAGFELIGKTQEKGKKITEKMEGVDGDVHYYKDKVDYIQAVKVRGKAEIMGKLEYQSCNGSMCLAPKKKPFNFKIKE